MNIEEIDKNLKATPIKETDVVWKDAKEKPFSLHGVFYSGEEQLYRRMPKEIADNVSWSVGGLSKHTSGGRIRFRTDSPYVAIRAVAQKDNMSSNGSLMRMYGFSVYSNGVFEGCLRPDFAAYVNATDKFAFETIAHGRLEGMRNIEIYFPLYGGICEVWVGLKEGSTVQEPEKYPLEKPIVFYGSSITQGGCASRPGNDYTAVLSRQLNFDYVNLGFSGSAKGEPLIADYLASLDASVMVLDYDFNAPNPEWLENTHYPMYEKIRKAHPDMPIVFMTRPNFMYDPKNCIPRRKVIYDNFLKAKASGDTQVYFCDGKYLFGKKDWSACTVDNCHPNDIGFSRMAKKLFPILKNILANK